MKSTRQNTGCLKITLALRMGVGYVGRRDMSLSCFLIIRGWHPMDFQTARRNMVDCQIHTGGVIDPLVLEAFQNVPRESFVPEELRNVACLDETISLGRGRFILEPLVHARMIQALGLLPSDVVLDIGGAGYSAALMASMAMTVVALEADEALNQEAQKHWKVCGASNVIPVTGDLASGASLHGPYNAILINGAIETSPLAFFDQLAPQGCLVAVLKQQGAMTGQIVRYTRADNGEIVTEILSDAAVPVLKGFETSEKFVF